MKLAPKQQDPEREAGIRLRELLIGVTPGPRKQIRPVSIRCRRCDQGETIKCWECGRRTCGHHSKPGLSGLAICSVCRLGTAREVGA